MAMYTVEEAAAIMKVSSVDTVKDWIRQGRLRASKLSGSKTLRISDDDLRDFYEKNATIPK